MKILNHIKQHKILYVSILLVVLFAIFGAAFALKNINRPTLTTDYRMVASWEYVNMLRDGEDAAQLKGVVKIQEITDSSSLEYSFSYSYYNKSSYGIETIVTTDDQQVENIKIEVYLTTNFLSMTHYYQELVNTKIEIIPTRYDKGVVHYGYYHKAAHNYIILESFENSYKINLPPDGYYQLPPLDVTDHVPSHHYFALVTVKKGIKIGGTLYDKDYLYGEPLVSEDDGTQNN